MSKEHGSLVEGLSQVTCPVMVVGVKSDILFPIMQQQELADTLLESGNGLNDYIPKKNGSYGDSFFRAPHLPTTLIMVPPTQ